MWRHCCCCCCCRLALQANPQLGAAARAAAAAAAVGAHGQRGRHAATQMPCGTGNNGSARESHATSRAPTSATTSCRNTQSKQRNQGRREQRPLTHPGRVLLGPLCRQDQLEVAQGLQVGGAARQVGHAPRGARGAGRAGAAAAGGGVLAARAQREAARVAAQAAGEDAAEGDLLQGGVLQDQHVQGPRLLRGRASQTKKGDEVITHVRQGGKAKGRGAARGVPPRAPPIERADVQRAERGPGPGDRPSLSESRFWRTCSSLNSTILLLVAFAQSFSQPSPQASRFQSQPAPAGKPPRAAASAVAPAFFVLALMYACWTLRL